MNDPRDFTGRYNTQLPADVEKMFGAWLVDESKRQGRNLSNDLYDYDLRGMWNAGAGFGGDNGHATDQWKKPNHPTFSDQSIYNGVDGFQGGHWQNGSGGGFQYVASPTNTYSPQELQQYFQRVEPDVQLILNSVLGGKQ